MNRFSCFTVKTQTKHHIMHVYMLAAEIHTHIHASDANVSQHRIVLLCKYSLAIVQELCYHYAYLSHFYASCSCYRAIFSAENSFLFEILSCRRKIFSVKMRKRNEKEKYDIHRHCLLPPKILHSHGNYENHNCKRKMKNFHIFENFHVI